MGTDRRGMTLVIVGLLLIPLTLLASLFLDMAKVYALRTEAQLSADAAALAGGSGLLEAGEGSDLVTARVNQSVSENEIGGTHAEIDSLVIDTDAGMLHLVLGYQTGPLILAPSGIRLQSQAGAQVSEETPLSEEGVVAAPVRKIRLR